MSIDTGHSLLLRSNGTSLDLCGRMEPLGAPWWIEAKAQGTEWGNPQAVITSIRSQLLDGSLGTITSYDNRTATIRLKIMATDAAALADGEAALMAALQWTGFGELVWTPPGPLGPAAVFEVVYGDPQFQFDDFDETYCWRTFVVTLDCRPFAASLNYVTVPALATATTPSTDTTVNAAGTWSSTNTGYQLWTATTPVNLGTKVYLTVAASTTMTLGTAGTPDFIVNGSVMSPVALSSSVSGSTTSYVATLLLSTAQAAAFSTLRVNSNAISGLIGGTTASITNASNVSPTATGFVKTQRFQVYGSMRTEGSVILSATADGTGVFDNANGVLVYTAPADVLQRFSPSLMQYRTVGPTRTTDSNQTSGAKNNLATTAGSADTFQFDATTLAEGTYMLVARFASTSLPTTGNVQWVISQSGIGDGGSAPLSAVVAPTFLILGYTTAPQLRARATGQNVSVLVWTDNTTTAVPIDDVFLLWIAPSRTSSPDRSGHVSILNPWSGVKTIEIDAPSITDTRPSYWFDGHEAGPVRATRDAPVFSPGTQGIYTVAAGLAGLTVSAKYRPHWHTHPAPLPSGLVLSAS